MNIIHLKDFRRCQEKTNPLWISHSHGRIQTGQHRSPPASVMESLTKIQRLLDELRELTNEYNNNP